MHTDDSGMVRSYGFCHDMRPRNVVHAMTGGHAALIGRRGRRGDAPDVVRGTTQRLRAAAAALVAGILGIAPHVLHHVGPLAGAALFAGLGGSVLFGAIGLALAVPMLLKIHRHTGGWRAPVAALAAMAASFSLSAFVVGPTISDADDEARPIPAQSAPPGAPARPAGKDAHGH